MIIPPAPLCGLCILVGIVIGCLVDWTFLRHLL